MSIRREISEEVLAFCQQAFRDHLEGTADDPSYLLHPYREAEPYEEIARLRRVAVGLGLDYDTILNDVSAKYKRDRLAQIEGGRIQPEPREKE
jgi:hypothetical protein